MHELPLSVLQFLSKEWKSAYANEVFILFVPAQSSLPSISNEHLGAFWDRLESLGKLVVAGGNARREQTALLVIASHAPASLDDTLRSLSLLHLPVLVIEAAARSEPTHGNEYRRVCSEHRALFERGDRSDTVLGALKEGIRRLLDDVELAWICSFDDTMLVRPDFMRIIERFRDVETRPTLSGFWNNAERAESVAFRDGFPLISVHRQTSIHLYGHRNYWSRRFSLGRESITKDAGDRWQRQLTWRSAAISVIPGLVTSQMMN